MLNESEIERIVNENLFTPETYPGCTDEEYAELNEKLLEQVIAEHSEYEDIYETIKRVNEKLYF